MREVAARLQVAHMEHRWLEPSLDRGHLLAERLDRAAVALARANVVERARDYDVQAEVIVVLEPRELGGDLADAVGAAGAHRVALGDRNLVGAHAAVLGAGAGDMNAGSRGVAAHGL